MDERMKTASKLSVLAQQIDALAEHTRTEGPRDSQTIEDRALVGSAALLLAISRSRRVLMAWDQTGEDYWDVLLSLFVIQIANQAMDRPVASVSIDWSSSVTKRWIALLRERGFVSVSGNTSASGGVLPHLTETGLRVIRDILSRFGDGVEPIELPSAAS